MGLGKHDRALNSTNTLMKKLAVDKKVILFFGDFKKVYDSVDRDTLINLLKEFITNDKTKKLINNQSEIKFLGELA